MELDSAISFPTYYPPRAYRRSHDRFVMMSSDLSVDFDGVSVNLQIFYLVIGKTTVSVELLRTTADSFRLALRNGVSGKDPMAEVWLSLLLEISFLGEEQLIEVSVAAILFVDH